MTSPFPCSINWISLCCMHYPMMWKVMMTTVQKTADQMSASSRMR